MIAIGRNNKVFPEIGGASSYALPGQADARARLARAFDDWIFFAGEATHGFRWQTARNG